MEETDAVLLEETAVNHQAQWAGRNCKVIKEAELSGVRNVAVEKHGKV